jgi:hypothetical protein
LALAGRVALSSALIYPPAVTLHRLLCLGLVAVVVTLAPAAHASPPDDSSFGGLYDNADFDDVVLLITCNLGAVQPPIIGSVRPAAPVVALVTPTGAGQRPLCALASALSRAPPRASSPRS